MGNKEKSKWLGLELNQGQFKIKRGRFHKTVTVGQSGLKFSQDYFFLIFYRVWFGQN